MLSQKSHPGSFAVIRTSILLTLVLLLAACGGGNSQGQSTPTEAQTIPFNLGIPQSALNSPIVGNVSDNTPLHVVVTFKPNDQLLNQLGSTPVSKANQGTDTATLANQLGITDQQYQQIKQFFKSQNFSLNLNKLHTALTIDATVGAFASLLQTKFVYHQYQNHKFFAPATPILLPQIIVQHIEAISGLDSYSRPLTSQAGVIRMHPLGDHVSQDSCFPYSDMLSNTQIANAYGFNQLARLGWEGQGTTIILPEFATFSQSDLNVYLSCVHFQGKIKYINVDNDPPTSDDLEPLLDLEMVAGLLPRATIVVYQTENTWAGFDDAFSQIASDYSNNHAPVEVSLSWGTSENWIDTNDLDAVDTAFKTMLLAEHLNVFSSSGDCGAYDSADYPATRDVDFPASDPYAIGVGGTSLTVSGSQRSQEVVWQGTPDDPPDCSNEWGSGGGLSSIFKRPSWQQSPGVQNKYSDGYREVPDISAVADNVACYVDHSWDYCYGTSEATPIWASGYAQIDEGLAATQQRLVSGPSTFYWLAQHFWHAPLYPFYDIVKGNNLYYPAAAGYDDASGLGTPNVSGLYLTLVQYIGLI